MLESDSTQRATAVGLATAAQGPIIKGNAIDWPIVSTAGTSARHEWDAFVESHAAATGYHLWAWREIFEDVFRHHCEYSVAHRNGIVTGVLPLVTLRSWLFGRFSVSLPYVNYGGILASDNRSARALLDHAVESANLERLTHIELRHRDRVFPDLPARQHKVAMVLPLASSPDLMWQALDRKIRNQVRKAEKSRLVVEIGGADLLNDFYTVFSENMRDLGTPVYSRRFFSGVLRVFHDRTNVHLVRLDGRPVAAGISFRYLRTIEVPWASSVRAFRPLCPNNLLYWSIIRWAIENKFEVFDFGRSTPEEGTFHFKRQWGAGPHPLYWEYSLRSRSAIPDHTPKNPRLRWAVAAWKRLPLRVTTLIGPSIVRGIP